LQRTRRAASGTVSMVVAYDNRPAAQSAGCGEDSMNGSGGQIRSGQFSEAVASSVISPAHASRFHGEPAKVRRVHVSLTHGETNTSD
jgi:hypothetical protein